MPDRHFELPAHPDLEYYRKQAKHLQRAYATGDAAAQARVADVLGDRAAERFLLSDAQFVLAQEHGFRTWAEFRADIQSQGSAGDRPVAGAALALDIRAELGPGPESVFLGEDELGVAEQEPLGGPVAQHVGDPGLGCRIARGVRALQVLGLLAVVLQVRMGRQLEMTVGHRNLLRRRGPLARPERGWSCPVR